MAVAAGGNTSAVDTSLSMGMVRWEKERLILTYPTLYTMARGIYFFPPRYVHPHKYFGSVSLA